MLKFFQDTGGPETEHGGTIHWPGTVDGFPYRGEEIPNLKQHEAADVPLALDYRSALFCLWKKEDKEQFDIIMDRIVNGWYMQHKRDDQWIESKQHYTVWLEWAQIYGEAVSAKVPGGNSNGITQSVIRERANQSSNEEAAQRFHATEATAQSASGFLDL
jgi:hypothetical protein